MGRGGVIGDAVVTAILDRMLHYSHDINIRRKRYRLREKRPIINTSNSEGGSVSSVTKGERSLMSLDSLGLCRCGQRGGLDFIA